MGRDGLMASCVTRDGCPVKFVLDVVQYCSGGTQEELTRRTLLNSSPSASVIVAHRFQL